MTSAQVLELSARFGRVAEGLDAAAVAMPSFSGTAGGWTGAAARAAEALLVPRPNEFRELAGAFRSAAAALRGHAAALERTEQLERTPAAADPLGPAVRVRASAECEASAAAVAARLHGLAGQAPRRPGRAARWLDAVRDGASEVRLGAWEGLEGLADLASRVSAWDPVRDLPSHDQLVDGGSAVAGAVRHPLQTLDLLVDGPTWRENPARAVGHLIPDAAATLFSGGTAAAARRSVIAGRESVAQARQQAANAARNASEAAKRTAAGTARARLVERALAAHADDVPAGSTTAAGGGSTAAGGTAARGTTASRGVTAGGSTAGGSTAGGSTAGGLSRAPGAGVPGGEVAWRGRGGVWLTARQDAATQAFLAEAVAGEASLTRTMEELSRSVGGQLEGLKNCRKEVDSFRRKVATALADETARKSLAEILRDTHDTVRYTVVLDEGSYTTGAQRIARQLEQAGFSVGKPPWNAWDHHRYHGVNSVWQDPRTGTAFEVQFHTPGSWEATRNTHPWYEEFRLPDTPEPRKEELSAMIGAEYARLPVPHGVERLTEHTFPPPIAAEPIAVPPQLAVPVGAGVAVASRSATDSGAPPPGHEGDVPRGHEVGSPRTVG